MLQVTALHIRPSPLERLLLQPPIEIHSVLFNGLSNCIVFIHFYSAFHSMSLRPQQLTLCRSLHAEALQTTASEGLAQGPYVAARAGFEPATIRSKGTDS